MNLGRNTESEKKKDTELIEFLNQNSHKYLKDIEFSCLTKEELEKLFKRATDSFSSENKQ